MKNWKKTAITASLLVFVCAGIYLNWIYTQEQDIPVLTDVLDAGALGAEVSPVMGGELSMDAGTEQVTDYFAAVRLSRQQSRDSAIATLQETMAYGGEETDYNAVGTLEELVDTALQEAQIESLVIAKGYVDCVAYMTGGGISVAVAAPQEGLEPADVSLISDIILTQTDLTLDNIRVIEVK